MKALSNALWMFSSCLSFFFNLSTWNSYNSTQFQINNNTRNSVNYNLLHTSCCNANFLSMVEDFPPLLPFLKLLCIFYLWSTSLRQLKSNLFYLDIKRISSVIQEGLKNLTINEVSRIKILPRRCETKKRMSI